MIQRAALRRVGGVDDGVDVKCRYVGAQRSQVSHLG